MKASIKKITSICLVFIIIVIQTIAYAVDVEIEEPTPDLVAPYINSISVSSNELTPTTPVIITVDIKDELSGFSEGYITYIKPNNSTIKVPFGLNSVTNNYEGTLTILETDVPGEWKPTNIYLKDKKDNYINLSHLSTQSNGEIIDFSTLHLNVTGVKTPQEPTDKEAPELENISVTSSQVTVNEKIEMIVEATDNESGIKTLRANYRTPSGAFKYINLYQNSIGQFVGSHLIGKYEESGEWTLVSVYTSDRSGNSKTYTSYVDTEGNQTGFEKFKVNVSGTIIDSEPPTLQEISVTSQVVKANEKIEVKAKVTDNESGASSVKVTYKNPLGEIKSFYLNKITSDEFVGSITVGQYEERGQRHLISVTLGDVVGNSKTITSYLDSDNTVKDFSHCTVEVTGTTPDWEGPEFTGGKISVQQISTNQAAVTIIIEVEDRVSGIAYNSLYGHYRKPSGRLLNLNFSKNNNQYTATILIDKYDELGVWKLENLTIYDAVGNNSISKRIGISPFSEFDINVMGKITITPGAPNNILVTAPSELRSGQTYQLKPILRSSNANNNDMDITTDTLTQYSSSNPELLVVDSKGFITIPEGAGSGFVILEVAYGNATKQLEIKINNGTIESFLQNSPLSITLHGGQSEQLKVVEIYDGARRDVTSSTSGISYSSSDPSLVTVSPDGLIQSVSSENQGVVDITVMYKGLKAKTTVKVTKPVVKSLSISPLEENLSISNNKLQLVLRAFMTDGTSRDVTSASTGTKYVSSNHALGQVSEDGLITIPSNAKSGILTISASNSNVTVKATINVTGVPELIGLKVKTLKEKMDIGEQQQLYIQTEWSDGSFKDVDIELVNFSSTRSDRVAVSTTGLVEAISPGISYIDMNFEGKSIRTNIEVLHPPTVMKVYLEEPLKSSLELEEKYIISNLKVEMSNGTINEVDIKEANIISTVPSRVGVDSGVLSALSSGIAYIDISYGGKTIRSSVTVQAGKTLSSISLATPLITTMIIGGKQEVGGLKAKWSDGTETDIAITEATISSTYPGRVKVTGAQLEALAIGTSYIDISYGGKTVRSSVTVQNGKTLSSISLATPLITTMIIGGKQEVGGLKAKWSDGTETDIAITEATISSTYPGRVKVTGAELEALASGTSYIDISYNGKNLRTAISVQAEKTLNSIYFESPLATSMKIGEKQQVVGLKAKWTDGTITEVPISNVSISSTRLDRVGIRGEVLEAISSGISYIDFKYKTKTLRITIYVN